MAKTRTAYIIRGIAGSGKTEFMKALVGENGVSADDYPKLYKGGVIQLEHQAASHRWCLAEFTKLAKAGLPAIGVANTFTRGNYYSKYIEVAQAYGYHVQVINCESVLAPEGHQLSSIHNVPESVIEHQIRDMQPFHTKPEPITIWEVLEAQKAIADRSGFIMVDIVGTIITAKPGHKYVNKLADALFIEERINWLIEQLRQRQQRVLYLLSNQCGVGNGSMSEDDLFEIYKAIAKRFDAEGIGCVFLTAHKRSGHEAIAWDSRSKKEEFANIAILINGDYEAAKPNVGLMSAAMLFASAEMVSQPANSRKVLYIGDAHSASRLDDILFTRNCNKNLGDSLEFTYIPAELANHTTGFV